MMEEGRERLEKKQDGGILGSAINQETTVISIIFKTITFPQPYQQRQDDMSFHPAFIWTFRNWHFRLWCFHFLVLPEKSGVLTHLPLHLNHLSVLQVN
jgi:hypothetical protein